MKNWARIEGSAPRAVGMGSAAMGRPHSAARSEPETDNDPVDGVGAPPGSIVEAPEAIPPAPTVTEGVGATPSSEPESASAPTPEGVGAPGCAPPSTQWGAHECGPQCTSGGCIKDTNYLTEQGMGNPAAGLGPTPCNCKGRLHPEHRVRDVPFEAQPGMGAVDFNRLATGLGDYPALALATIKVGALASNTDTSFANNVGSARDAVNISVSEAVGSSNATAAGLANDTMQGTAWAWNRNADVISMLAGQQSGQGPNDTIAAARTDIMNAFATALGNAKLALDALAAPPTPVPNAFSAGTVAAATAVKALASPCNLTASCATVKAFQNAYNADPAKVAAIAIDGRYAAATAAALVQVLGTVVANPCTAFTGACAGGTPPNPNPAPNPTPAASSTNWTPWIIGGAVAGGVGLVAWAIFSKPSPQMVAQAAKELREEAATTKKRKKKRKKTAALRA